MNGANSCNSSKRTIFCSLFIKTNTADRTVWPLAVYRDRVKRWHEQLDWDDSLIAFDEQWIEQMIWKKKKNRNISITLTQRVFIIEFDSMMSNLTVQIFVEATIWTRSDMNALVHVVGYKNIHTIHSHSHMIHVVSVHCIVLQQNEDFKKIHLNWLYICTDDEQETLFLI